MERRHLVRRKRDELHEGHVGGVGQAGVILGKDDVLSGQVGVSAPVPEADRPVARRLARPDVVGIVCGLVVMALLDLVPAGAVQRHNQIFVRHVLLGERCRRGCFRPVFAEEEAGPGLGEDRSKEQARGGNQSGNHFKCQV